MPDFDTFADANITDENADGIEYEFDTEGDTATADYELEANTLDTDNDSTGKVTASGEAPKVRSRGKKSLTRNQVAKILTKHSELEGADQAALDVLAISIGAKSTPNDITTVLFSTGRVNLSPIVDLLAIAEAGAESPYQGILKAMQLDRDQAKPIWQTLSAIGAVTGNVPAKESAASVAIAEAAAELSGEHTRLLDRARELARK